MALHCSECGFVNPEGANYCQKCGAYLARPEGEDASTMAYKVGETGEYEPVDVDEEVDKAGAALVVRSGGGRAGESFTVDRDRMSIGRTPDAAVFLDDVTVSRNHALIVRRRDGLYIDDLGLAERHLREPAPDRVAQAGRRRRDPDRQVQAELPGALTMAVATTREDGDTGRAGAERRSGSDSPSRPRKALTIGAVAKILSQEFDDISISKIRYLEDQKLLTPRRTQGGYRLYSQTDVERLRAILRMQRDEFLPLRVIRQELATGDFTGVTPGERGGGNPAGGVRGRPGLDAHAGGAARRGRGVGGALARASGVRHRPARPSRRKVGLRRDGPRDRPRGSGAVAVRRRRAQSARLRTSADREAALLQQLVGPALRSRSQARRKEAIENLESLAAVCGHLKHLLLVRDLRRLKGD